jgi:hypothetical protein
MVWTTDAQTYERRRIRRIYATEKNVRGQSNLNTKAFTGERRIANGKL